MDIIISFINTLYLFIFMLSVVNIIRHAITYYFDVIAPAEPEPFEMVTKERLFLMISVAIMFTCIFTGFKII